MVTNTPSRHIIIDNHVHVGWYTDGYHSPIDVWQSEVNADVTEIVVSSTSTCAELYKLVILEMKELIKIGGPCVHPILWITPRMMKSWGIRYMLHSKIRWQGIKLHWQAHREWYYNKKLLREVIELARKLKIPVLLHTGEFNECRAGVFFDLCKQNSDLNFVLAHGRPFDETLNILFKCPNTFVDTAFMPTSEIKELVNLQFEDRVLFGTDVPINRSYYKDITTSNFIERNIETLKDELPIDKFATIMSNRLYKHV